MPPSIYVSTSTSWVTLLNPKSVPARLSLDCFPNWLHIIGLLLFLWFPLTHSAQTVTTNVRCRSRPHDHHYSVGKTVLVTENKPTWKQICQGQVLIIRPTLLHRHRHRPSRSGASQIEWLHTRTNHMCTVSCRCRQAELQLQCGALTRCIIRRCSVVKGVRTKIWLS